MHNNESLTTNQLLQENLELVAERDPNLMATFYGLLFERFPSVKPLFGRNSAVEQQKMLTDALTVLVSHLDDPEFVTEKMSAIGRKHVDYKVEDHMYPWVGECLLETLKRGSGDDWSPRIETAWGAVLMTISEIAIAAATEERARRQSASSSAART